MATQAPPAPAPAISEERLRKAVEYIEEDEGATSRYRGWLARLATLLLVGMSLFHLYAAVDIVPAQVLRPVHVGWVLLLVFLLFPVASRYPQPAHVVGRRARGRRRSRPSSTCCKAVTTSGTATRCPTGGT